MKITAKPALGPILSTVQALVHSTLLTTYEVRSERVSNLVTTSRLKSWDLTLSCPSPEPMLLIWLYHLNVGPIT